MIFNVLIYHNWEIFKYTIIKDDVYTTSKSSPNISPCNFNYMNNFSYGGTTFSTIPKMVKSLYPASLTFTANILPLMFNDRRYIFHHWF